MLMEKVWTIWDEEKDHGSHNKNKEDEFATLSWGSWTSGDLQIFGFIIK